MKGRWRKNSVHVLGNLSKVGNFVGKCVIEIKWDTYIGQKTKV